jgi:hypothetical protein
MKLEFRTTTLIVLVLGVLLLTGCQDKPTPGHGAASANPPTQL